jgi:hypothetical protein
VFIRKSLNFPSVILIKRLIVNKALSFLFIKGLKNEIQMSS